MSALSLPARIEINVEHTWDLTNIFGSVEEWTAAIDALQLRLADATLYQGKMGDDPATLVEALDTFQSIALDARRISMYAFLSYSVETTNQTAGARTGQASTLASQVQAALSFVEPELLTIGADKLATWMEVEPRLAQYDHYFKRIEDQRNHLRSNEVEELLGLVHDPFSTASATHSILTNADLTCEPAQNDDGSEQFDLAPSTAHAMASHPDRSVRRSAWENYADAHLAYRNSMANCLMAGVKQDVFFAKARRYDSSLEASLMPHGIPNSVFHNLIDTFRKHLPTWHRYWRLRRKALGYETLREYDINAPLTAAKIEVPYEEAVDWIALGMAPLGVEYVDVLRQGALEERWVDIYPNQGKSAGAFSWGAKGTHPFIMMSYSNDLLSLSTLAHELGHSMHSYLTWQTQPAVYSEYSLFVAEVASNFNQALVRSFLFETQTDPDFQIALIEEAMSNFHRYFFIMPTLARFELVLHERVEAGRPMSADEMTELMADLFAEGYGDELAMDRERSGITWAQFSSHLYANFYVYQYATGISGAHALANRVLAGQLGAVEQYLNFLRAGCSRYPLDVLKEAGTDLTSPAPVEETFGVLAGLVDRLEALVDARS